MPQTAWAILIAFGSCKGLVTLEAYHFFSTNSFWRQLSSKKNWLELFSSESSLRAVLQIVENWFTFINHWSLDILNLHWPYWISRSSLTTIQPARGIEISHILWMKRFLSNFNVVAIQNSLDGFCNTLNVRKNSKTSRWFPFIKSVTIYNCFWAVTSLTF